MALFRFQREELNGKTDQASNQRQANEREEKDISFKHGDMAISIFEMLYPKTANATDNCTKLDEYHKKNSLDKKMTFCNPRTDIYKIAEMIIIEDKKGGIL